MSRSRPGAAEILACRACPSMEGARRVPGEGRRGARLFFLAEAPGRLGAGRTGRPFVGDASGRLFRAMLSEVGVPEDQVYVTNAVKCTPADERGHNRRPTWAEVGRCAGFWRRELAWARPALVVPLGEVACRQVLGRPIREAVGRLVQSAWGPAFALYHPAYASRHAYGMDAYRTDWGSMAAALRVVEAGGAGAGPEAALEAVRDEAASD